MLVLLYKSLIKHNKLVFLLSLAFCVFFSFFASKLSVDASAESLLLEDDKDLAFFREVNKNYKSDDFLMLAFKPKDEDPFSPQSLALIKSLQIELESVKGVQKILSLINAPLLKSSDDKELKELLLDVPNLTSKDINLTKARTEITNSPFYKDNIISKDGKSTALIIYLSTDLEYMSLLESKNLEKDTNKKAQIQKHIDEYKQKLKIENKQRLEKIKSIIQGYEAQTSGLYLSGVSMIADDMIAYIKDDLLVYGLSLALLLSLVLWLFFRKIYLVLFVIFVCLTSLASASGIFTLLGFKITVISSSYLALMLIITISLIIHLLTHFINLCKKFPKASTKHKILATLLAKSRPSYYAILTTAIGFLSLILSKIEPVIKLGVMMSVGISISLILTFLFFASIFPFFKNLHFEDKQEIKLNFLAFCASLSLKYPKKIIFLSLIFVLVSLFGINKLRVENSFVSYFKDSSAIKQGLVVIDKELGGTLPLELVLSFENSISKEESETINENALTSKDSEFASFESEFEDLSKEDTYWFNAQKTSLAKKIHEYLQKKEFVGSVLSLNSLLSLGKDLNEGKDLDDFALAFLNENLPQSFKQTLLSPYVNIEKNELRFIMRIRDSDPKLQRNEFIKELQSELTELTKNDGVQIKLTGIMLLYNNMLQSLFASQFNTLAFVVGTIFLLFIFVFSSIKYAFVGIVANVVPICLVFALMGFCDLPLDLMTVIIAAICIGIGVDDSIHYIYNFKKELASKLDLSEAIRHSHLYIGQALFQSKVAIILGFSTMISSNFMPTIYFAFLTVLVMLLLLVGSLILLPSLLFLLSRKSSL